MSRSASSSSKDRKTAPGKMRRSQRVIRAMSSAGTAWGSSPSWVSTLSSRREPQWVRPAWFMSSVLQTCASLMAPTATSSSSTLSHSPVQMESA